MIVNAIFGAGTAGKSYVVTRQRRLNCYYENRKDKDKSPIAVYGTPGLKPLATIGSVVVPARGLFGTASFLYAVFGGNFFQLTPTLSTAYTAAIGTLTGPVTFTTTPTQVVLVDGTSGYLLVGGALVLIASAGFPSAARTITNCNGYLVAEAPGTQRFQVSAQFDGSSWNPLAFGSASNYPDIILAVDTLIGNLLLFCSTHLEFWQNIGATPQPFGPIFSATVEYGLAAIFSRAHVDSGICFLAQRLQGGFCVCRITGYSVNVISDPDLESIFGTFSTVADAEGLAYQADNHPMYQLTFPTANRSFLWDASTGIWSETQTGLTAAYAQRHIARFSTLFNGVAVISNYTNNKLYTADSATFTDDGQVIPRRIITRHHLHDHNVFSIDEAFLDMETGVGLPSGQGSNPQIALSCSKNNGRTFSTERWNPLQAQGNYVRVPPWRRWGSARVFDFNVYMTDPVKFAMTSGAFSEREREQ